LKSSVNRRLAWFYGAILMVMSMFVSFLGVLLVTLVVFLGVWAIGRITLGR
jgi:hypothetical protein